VHAIFIRITYPYPLLLLQERNMNHPNGGPEASRITAAARRKLGTLGTSLDQLFKWLDSADAQVL
jgi:SYP5 family syntaxin